MDTDDLTNMAFQSIIIAEEINDFLKAELGAEARHHKTEDEYLNAILKKVRDIKKDINEFLEYWDILKVVNINIFKKDLKKLEMHILNTIETSMSKRRKYKLQR